jgi:hypothetical protein
MRKLPGEYVTRQDERWNIKDGPSLRKGPNEGRQCPNHSSRQRILTRYLFHWQVNAKIAKPYGIGYQESKWNELAVGGNGGETQRRTDEAPLLSCEPLLDHRPILGPVHQRILFALCDLAEALARHRHSLGGEKEHR